MMWVQGGCPCGNNTLPTEVDAICPTLRHGINIILHIALRVHSSLCTQTILAGHLQSLEQRSTFRDRLSLNNGIKLEVTRTRLLIFLMKVGQRSSMYLYICIESIQKKFLNYLVEQFTNC